MSEAAEWPVVDSSRGALLPLLLHSSCFWAPLVFPAAVYFWPGDVLKRDRQVAAAAFNYQTVAYGLGLVVWVMVGLVLIPDYPLVAIMIDLVVMIFFTWGVFRECA